MGVFLSILTVVLLFFIGPYLFHIFLKKSEWRHPRSSFPDEWKIILSEYVSFYNKLNPQEKVHFEIQVHRFINNIKIKGNGCEIDIVHRLLVASSATIPVFAFRGWEYVFLEEVILYPSAFEFPGEGPYKGKKMLGVVGGGQVLKGKLLLSRAALIDGFRNDMDKRNVAIHEFMHLVDKADGKVDGIPANLLEQQFTLPWIHLMLIKMREIRHQRSDIRKYGSVNAAEFLAVTAEYFFERPEEFRKNHPRLYVLFVEMFRQEPHKRNWIDRRCKTP